MNLYLKSGYIDWERLAKVPASFLFVYGGRGAGKTYGCLKYVLEHKIPFIFTRRQQQEYDMVCRDDTSPFKVLNEDLNLDIHVRTISKNVSGIYQGDSSLPIGYMTSLGAFAHIRGMDFSDVKWWIYDEFIPEPHVRPMKEEGQAWANAYETICRNRELKGEDPVKFVGLANTNNLANPLFVELELVGIVERLRKRGTNYFLIPDRGIALVDTVDSPISGEKKETALYKLMNKNSEYYRMSIENRFRDLDEAKPVSRNLNEYRPVVEIAEITLYRHKHERKFYCSMHHTGVCKTFTSSEIDKERCLRAFEWIPQMYLENKIEFETYMCEVLFNRYLFS